MITRRLLKNGWKQSITTSTHLMYFKQRWQCTINKVTREVVFSYRKGSNLRLMSGDIEMGIE